ncbi:sugar ABC transporter permease [Actinomycetaceae bacterium TAE3-ERU4]|nr:sugar ABC transporter permease [Actinomycetaceae bacterium TAE3-ERU4]
MKSHRWYTPYILLAPAIIWVVVFAIWPFLNTIVLSFTDARPLRPVKGVGFQNYIDLFSDERFTYAMGTSLVYVVVCVPLLTFLPLLLALLVEKKVPGIGFFRTTFYFPVIASVVVVAIIWTWLFDSKGIINQSMELLGLTDKPVLFLIDRWLIVFTAISLTIWKGLGYYMVVYLAALSNVSKELHEAAALDGAGPIRRFWTVTVPAVKGAMMLISALVCVAAIRIFAEIYVLTGGTGGPGGQAQSIVMLIQQTGKGLNGRLGYASAVSVVLFLLTIIPLAFTGYINQREEVSEMLKNRRARKRSRKLMSERIEAAQALAVNETAALQEGKEQ